MTVLPAAGQEWGVDGLAPATRALVDTEARRIIEDCYEQPLGTLRYSRDRLARPLMGRETLDEDEAHAPAGIRRDTAPAAVARGGTGESPGKPGMAVSGG